MNTDIEEFILALSEKLWTSKPHLTNTVKILLLKLGMAYYC